MLVVTSDATQNTDKKTSQIVYLILAEALSFRYGPAAVILPLPFTKGTLSAIDATVSTYRNGKAADRAGKSEDLP